MGDKSDKKWTVPAEVREKMSESAKRSWEAGGRKAPVVTLKEKNNRLQDHLEDVKARLARLERRDQRIREVIRRHRELIDKGRAAPEGKPIRSFTDELMEAWDAED